MVSTKSHVNSLQSTLPCGFDFHITRQKSMDYERNMGDNNVIQIINRMISVFLLEEDMSTIKLK